MAGLRPGHPRLPYLSASKTWMPGIADKFTQSAQGRLLWPGMTSFATETDFIGCCLSQTLRSVIRRCLVEKLCCGRLLALFGPCAMPDQLNIRKHLQQISIRVTEEQRAMSKDLVSGR